MHPRVAVQRGGAASGDDRMNVRAAVSHARHLGPRRHAGGSFGRLMLSGLVALLLLLGTVTSGQRLAPAANAQGPTVIRVSFEPLPIDAPLLVAKDKGYFEKAGVNGEL